MVAKLRLDQLLVNRGLVDSKTKAQALIMAGKVFSGEQKLDKPGAQVKDDIPLHLKEAEHPWVSRGGMKLAKAIEHFGLHKHVKAAVALDIGASTGGFTDVLLHHGAQKVYAVDVGYGQLDQKLRNDARVVVMEKTNARDVTTQRIPDPLAMIVCDASFISLTKVLPASLVLANKNTQLVALIKPQFEVGKAMVSAGKGVIRDPEIHQQVCDEIEQWVTEQGWKVHGIEASPITGPKGNKEFLLYATLG